MTKIFVLKKIMKICIWNDQSLFPPPSDSPTSRILNLVLSASANRASTAITACHSHSVSHLSKLEIIFSFVNNHPLHSACSTED